MKRLLRVCLFLLPWALSCGTKPAAGPGPTATVEQPIDLAALFANDAPGPEERLQFKDYNLVFISFDALQAKHLGCYGYRRPVSPGIDFMAARGYRFTQCYSVASWTVPASMTWFTGVYPSEHGMTNKYTVFNRREQKLATLNDRAPKLVTLAEELRAHGYATGGFTGNAGLNGGFGYERGFDTYFAEPGKFGQFDESVPRALAWAKQQGTRKFFLFLHGYDIHGQSIPGNGLDERFVDPGYDRRFTGSPQEQEMLREQGLDRGLVELRPGDVDYWRAIYDEKIQRADRRFQEFLVEYAKLGLLQKTIFVITSDHGTELHEHRRFDHGFTLYNELIQVPLIIVLPQGRPGRSLSEPVSSIDVLPTLLDLLDVSLREPLGKQLRGHSLVATIAGKHQPRPIYAETDYREFTYKRAMIDEGRWKFIYTLERRERELYDLANDPGEQHNLAGKDVTKANQLERKLFQHFKTIGHDLTTRPWAIGLNPVYPSQGK